MHERKTSIDTPIGVVQATEYGIEKGRDAAKPLLTTLYTAWRREAPLR